MSQSTGECEPTLAAEVPPLSRLAKFILAALVIGLFVDTFRRPLFLDENFVFRDAGHFYYPYFQIQIDQWRQGRVPAWNPYENGGEPLAANPTASVFYPGKLIFVLDYATAYKWYLMAHLALAGLACFVAARGFGVSTAGAVLAGVSYAFSGFVFFQLYNIVFLVGAAWLPIGILAVDRLVRAPSLGWSLVLGAALALQVLGGDPQAAELTGVFAVGYLVLFHLGAKRGFVVLAALCGVGAGAVQVVSPLAKSARVAWISSRDGGEHPGVATIFADNFARHLQGRQATGQEWSTAVVVGVVVGGISGFIGALVLWRARGWFRGHTTRRSLWLLILSGAMGFGLSAIQVLPTLEFASRTSRASPDVPEETAAFSLHPARLAELVFPAVYGRLLPENSRWFPFLTSERSVWTPTLYLGLAPVLLSLMAMKLRSGSVPARWLTWLAILSLWMALGKFGGFAWLWNPSRLGVRDPLNAVGSVRQHGENDGLYWLLENTIPGFAQFRYPSKLLVFATLAVAILGGLGWDRVIAQERMRVFLRLLASILVVAVVMAAVVVFARSALLDWLDLPTHDSSTYGPFNADLAWVHLLESSLHTAVTLAALLLALTFLRRSPHRPQSLAAIAVVAITCLDLGVADRWLVLTDEQSVIDAKPAVLAAIESDAVAQGVSEPYRIFRTRLYEPLAFRRAGSSERLRESTRWERTTAQAKYAIPWGFRYAKTEGTMTLFDLDFFFAPWTVPTPPELRGEGQRRSSEMVYFPKNGLDLWGARYFILPRLPTLDDPDRGVMTLLADRSGQPLPVVRESPPEMDDFVVLRNPEAFPLAWIVREVEIVAPIHDMRKDVRGQRLERLLYRSSDAGFPLWHGKPHGDYPMRDRAMVEATSRERAMLQAALATPSETDASSPDDGSSGDALAWEIDQPDYVRLRVESAKPGLLVLAETYFPGWQATVDGLPAHVFRVNQAMRGVLVDAGTHTVELRYSSATLQFGAVVSMASLALLLLACGITLWRRPPLPRIADR